MARCWTCGRLTSEPVYKCSTCRNERSLKALGDELGIDINRLAKVEQQGFESLSDY